MLFFKLTILFGIIIGLMLIVYEDGTPFALFKKLMCKLGLHKIRIKLGKLKINKYYCQNCKKPRKHPQLFAIEGGNKIRDDRHKF